MEWHESIRNISDENFDEHMDIDKITNADRRRLRVRMIFR